jgi:hypothetical protein
MELERLSLLVLKLIEWLNLIPCALIRNLFADRGSVLHNFSISSSLYLLLDNPVAPDDYC